MAEPFKQQFELPDGKTMTAVVMDHEDFDSLCDGLDGIVEITTKDRANEDLVGRIREAGHLPMMARGTKTQFAFDRFEIETDLASFIVRGKGKEIMKSIVESN
jgi:hypothetical protein